MSCLTRLIWTLVFAVIVYSVPTPGHAADSKTKIVKFAAFQLVGPEKDKVAQYIYDIGTAVMAARGYKAEFYKLPFKRALLDAEVGKYDGIYGVYFSPKRSKVFAYSDKIYDVETSFFKMKDRDLPYQGIADLEGYTVGHINGAANGQEFERARHFDKTALTNKVQMLRMLEAGRVDFILDARNVVPQIIRSKLPHLVSKIEVLEPSFRSRGIYAAFSKKSPNYLQDLKEFNAGLAELTQKGTIQKIFRSYGIEWRRSVNVK